MSKYAAPIEIYQAAMPMIGAQPPASISDSSDEAVAATAAYEGLVEEALTMYGWSFATKYASLTQIGATNLSPAYNYSLPSDILLPRWVLLDTIPFREYQIIGGQLWADISDDGLTLFYTYRSSESTWSADFAEAIVYKLASRLAMTFANENLGQSYDATARELLRRARARDRWMSKAPRRDKDPTLVRAWRGSSATGALYASET